MSILSWLKRRRLDDQDFEEEIRAHLAIAADERIADGADRESAQLASLKDFGNVTLTTEAARRVWTPWWLDALHDQVSDVRYAIRALAKNPVFSLTVIGVLTLGIGLNAAVFTMLKGLALTPARRRRAIRRRSPSSSARRARGRQLRLSYPDYQYLRDHDRAFSALIGSTVASLGLGRGRSARPIWARARHRQLLSGARRPRRARPHAAAVGRNRARPPSRRRAQRRPVAPRLRRRSRTSSARRSRSTTTR